MHHAVAVDEGEMLCHYRRRLSGRAPKERSSSWVAGVVHHPKPQCSSSDKRPPVPHNATLHVESSSPESKELILKDEKVLDVPAFDMTDAALNPVQSTSGRKISKSTKRTARRKRLCGTSDVRGHQQDDDGREADQASCLQRVWRTHKYQARNGQRELLPRRSSRSSCQDSQTTTGNCDEGYRFGGSLSTKAAATSTHSGRHRLGDSPTRPRGGCGDSRCRAEGRTGRGSGAPRATGRTSSSSLGRSLGLTSGRAQSSPVDRQPRVLQ